MSKVIEVLLQIAGIGILLVTIAAILALPFIIRAAYRAHKRANADFEEMKRSNEEFRKRIGLR